MVYVLTPNDLPVEMVCEVLRRLSLKDLYLPEGDKIHLDLPELKQLEVACKPTREMRISSSLLQVEHPETVVTLDSGLPGERLKSFRNVRHLRSSSHLRILDERTLLDFSDLKEIAYIGTYDDVWNAFKNGFYNFQDDLSPYRRRIRDKEESLGSSRSKGSFELVDHKPIDDYKFSKFFRIMTIGSKVLSIRFISTATTTINLSTLFL